MKILVLPDLHYTQTRKMAISVAEESLFAKIKGKKFEYVIALGDIFNKFPSMEERVMFAEFIQKIKKHTKKIILIKGTNTHAFSNGIYHLEDIIKLTNIKAHDIFEINEYVFGHFEVKGAVYSNGYKSESQRQVDKTKKYMLGHIHLPQDVDSVTYLGSFYKTSFAERAEQKRFAIIEITDKHAVTLFEELKSRPMYQLEITGKEGKVTIKNLKQIKEKEIDLKLVGKTDSRTKLEVDRAINLLKTKLNIEYYQEDIDIEEVEVNMPKNLNHEELLKEYCKEKKINYALVEKEIKK